MAGIHQAKDELNDEILDVVITGGGVPIVDGVDSSIEATVFDKSNSNPLAVAIVDGSGDQITSFGGGTQYTEGDTDASITGTALLWEDTSNTLRPASAAKPFPVAIISGAGSGGTASDDDADFTAGTTAGTPAMGVFESSPTSVTDGDMGIVGITAGRRLKTSATIDAALPAGTNAIGKLSANSGVDIGDVDVTSSALPTGASTSAKQDTIIGHLDGVEGLLTTIDADTGGILTSVQLIDDAAATIGTTDLLRVALFDASDNQITTFGGGEQHDTNEAYTDADTGTVALVVRDDALTTLTEADGDYSTFRVDSTGALWIRASAPIAVTQSGTWDEVGINDSGNSITVDATNLDIRDLTNSDIVTAELSATDNAVLDAIAASVAAIDADTTAIIADTTNIETAVQLIDDTVYADDADWTDDTSKHMLVGGVYQSSPHTVTDGDVTPFLTDVNGRLIVAATDNGGSLTIDGTVTANLSATDNAVLDDIAADTESIKTAVEILDNAISGSEMQVDIVGALPAGTNAIGKLAANSGVDIGDVDITSIAAGDNNIGNVDVVTLPALPAGTNAIGKLVPADKDITGHSNYAKKYYTNAGAVTDGIIWSPAAGTRWHITAIYIQVSAAATITLEDDKSGGDEAIWKSEFTANQGVFMKFDPLYPWASGEDAADLTVTTTAGNVYATVVGYEI